MPAGLNVVVDLSHYQTPVDFPRIKAAGIVGVIHKASQGTGNVDPTYAVRMPLAVNAGLLWGAYHFGTNSDGAAQADHFLATATPTAETLLALDFEENWAGSTMSIGDVRKFVQRVFDITGRYVGLYSDNLIIKALSGFPQPDPLLKNCFLWYANYTSQPPFGLPSTFPTWTLWQYTDGKHGSGPFAVDGVGICDRDCFNGSLAGLKALWNSPN